MTTQTNNNNIKDELGFQITQDQIEQMKQTNRSLQKRWEVMMLNRERLIEMTKMLSINNLFDYVENRNIKRKSIQGYTMMGLIVYSALKPKRIVYKFLGVSIIMLTNKVFYEFYTMRQQAKNVSLMTEYNVNEQQIRNLYQFYFPNDPDIGKIRKNSQTYLKYMAIQQEIQQRKNEIYN